MFRLLTSDSVRDTVRGPSGGLKDGRISANRLVNTETLLFQLSDTGVLPMSAPLVQLFANSSLEIDAEISQTVLYAYKMRRDFSPRCSSVCRPATRLLHVLHGCSVRHIVSACFCLSLRSIPRISIVFSSTTRFLPRRIRAKLSLRDAMFSRKASTSLRCYV